MFFYDYRKEEYLKKIKKRSINIFIPYLFYSTCYYLLYYFNTYSFSNLINFVISGESFLWFVRDLILYTFLANIILKCISNNKMVLINVILNILLILFGVARYKSIIYWWGIYLLGAYAGKNYQKFYIVERKIERLVTENTLIIFILILLLFLYSFFMPNFKSINSIYINAYYITFRYMSLIIFWIIVLYFNDKLVVRRFMENSFIYYCWHPAYIAIISILLDKLLPYEQTFIILIKYFFTIFFCYILIYASFSLIKRFFPKIALFLNGYRKF